MWWKYFFFVSDDWNEIVSGQVKCFMFSSINEWWNVHLREHRARESISINSVECMWMICENCEQIFVKIANVAAIASEVRVQIFFSPIHSRSSSGILILPLEHKRLWKLRLSKILPNDRHNNTICSDVPNWGRNVQTLAEKKGRERERAIEISKANPQIPCNSNSTLTCLFSQNARELKWILFARSFT